MICSPPRGSLFVVVLTGLHCVAAQEPPRQQVAENAQADTPAAAAPATGGADNVAPAADAGGDPGEDSAGGEQPKSEISGPIPGASQLGASQLGASQLGASQLGASQLGASQLGASQLGASQLEVSELDPNISEDDYKKEFDRRATVFRDCRSKLEQALGDQRETFIRYYNDEDRSPEAKELYFEERQKVRALMDQTYLAALDVMRMAPEADAATFVATMVQHRFGLDIYDEPTLEGAARLIDGGSKMTYLFQAAARSAVVEGRFDMAKRLFEAIDEDQMETVDGTMQYLLDEYQASFEREKLIREKEAQEDRLPRVALRTTQGDVVVELFLDQAPSTVSNFIRLVEEGFYDGLDFHQVIDHLFALTGDPSGLGDGNSGKFLIDEHDREGARNAFRGSLVMAKVPIGETGKFVPNSASSQFAIVFLPILSVSEQQTVFGRVIEGMDAISRLRRVDPNKSKGKSDIVLPTDRIIEATVIRRPEQLPEPRYFDARRR